MNIQRLRTLNKVLGAISIVGWLFYLAALNMFHYARPEPENFYDTVLLGNAVNVEWNPTYVDLFIFFASAGILVSLIALVLNIYLYRAKRTHIWINLIILILACVSTLTMFAWSTR